MKRLEIKDWLWQKIARENNAPRVWIPKSQTEWVESEDEGTKICESYEEAMEHVKYLRSCFC